MINFIKMQESSFEDGNYLVFISDRNEDIVVNVSIKDSKGFSEVQALINNNYGFSFVITGITMLEAKKMHRKSSKGKRSGSNSKSN